MPRLFTGLEIPADVAFDLDLMRGGIIGSRWIDPESTSFERGSIYQIAATKPQPWAFGWRQTWVPYEQISKNLKRAIIASEDASFTDHDGVDWAAIEKAWDKNKKA